MKKLIIVIMLLSLILIAACNGNVKDNNNNNDGVKIPVLAIKDYFPFTENSKYMYTGEGNEYASYTVYTDYITETRVQTRTNNGGTEIVKVIEMKDGQLKEIFSRGETYFRENFTDTKSDDGEILLKEPLIKGTSWTTGDNINRSITNVDVELTTPLGTYKALEVTSEGKDYKIVDYYAKDIGLIKTVNTGNGYEVSSTLSKIENDVPLVQNINIYYPDMKGDILNSTNIPISFNTNDEPKELLEKTIKEMAEASQLMSTNTKINNLYLNDDGMVYVDFSKEFITEMNAGSAYEAMILQSITNTLGKYYGVENVYITLDGKPYESGHIMMKEGEPFTVDLKNVKPTD